MTAGGGLTFPSRCLMDSKLTSSRSKFQSRIQDDKLQVQLDAFLFAQETRSEVCNAFIWPSLHSVTSTAVSLILGRSTFSAIWEPLQHCLILRGRPAHSFLQRMGWLTTMDLEQVIASPASLTSPSCRWVSASENDQVCSCCDTGCTVRKGRSLEPAGVTSGFEVFCCSTCTWQIFNVLFFSSCTV